MDIFRWFLSWCDSITKSRSGAPIKISMTVFKELENTILKLLWKHERSRTVKELLNWTISVEPSQRLTSVHTSEVSDPDTVLAQSQSRGSVSLLHTRSSLQKHTGSMYLRTYNPFSFFCCGEKTRGAEAAWGEKAHTSGSHTICGRDLMAGTWSRKRGGMLLAGPGPILR